MAMGGAGAVHGGRQAADLGISTLIVPQLSPVLCALGDVVADLKVSEMRTLIGSVADLDLERLNTGFEAMEAAARARLAGQAASEGLTIERSVDLRYAGEVHEVTVPVRSRTRGVTPLNLEATVEDFHRLHEASEGRRRQRGPRAFHRLPAHASELLSMPPVDLGGNCVRRRETALDEWIANLPRTR